MGLKGPCIALISAPGFVQDQLADDLRLDIQEEPQIHVFETAVKEGFVMIPEAKISALPPLLSRYFISAARK